MIWLLWCCAYVWSDIIIISNGSYAIAIEVKGWKKLPKVTIHFKKILFFFMKACDCIYHELLSVCLSITIE